MKQPSRRVIISDDTYQRLRSAIIRGAIPPGARLTEVQLARDLSVSRTPVREALRRLESDGLVNLDRNGAFSLDVSRDSAREILVMQELLEPYCADVSAPRLERSACERLGSISPELANALAVGIDHVALAGLSVEFHDVLYRACPYARLTEVMMRYRDHAVTYWVFGMYGQEDLRHVVELHRDIESRAVAVAKDTGGAARGVGARVREHIAYARQAIEQRGETSPEGQVGESS